MFDLTGRRFGQYEIVSLLGQGGMASVYRARQLNIERNVAVKIIKSELLDQSELLARFDREAQTIASLSHPHIVKLFDYGHQDGIVYFVMELLAGGSLAESLANERPTLERVDRLVDQIGSALSYAHQQGIIHRDLKPQNVLLDKNGNAILTDFGIAQLLTANTMITKNGETVGTPAYMSPEQWQSRPLDLRADIYSFGVILFEMLSGQHPFSGDTPFQIMHKHIYEPVPSLRDARPEMPISMERVLNQALAKQPRDRFESVDALVKAYQRARLGMSDEAVEAVDTKSALVELVTLQHESASTTAQGNDTHILSPETKRGIPTGSNRQVNLSRRWLVVGGVVVIALATLALFVTRNAPSTAPTSTPIVIQPVAEGEYMILVSQVDQLDSVSQGVTQFITDDLTQSFETGISYSNLRVRSYPRVIHSSQEAIDVAKTVHAAVVLWGNTSNNTTDLQIQVGDSSLFPYNQCPEDWLRRTSDVRLRLTDARSQSASISTIFTFVMAQVCAGDGFEIMRLYSILDAMQGTTAGELVGVGTSIQLQKALAYYQSDTKRSTDALSDLIDRDPGRPLLYVIRAATYQRLGQVAASEQDMETALRLGKSAWQTTTWATPVYLQMFNAFIAQDYQKAITLLNTIIQMRPKDWFAYSVRAANYYLLHDYDRADADLQQSINLHAPVNFPYMLDAVMALRKGRINDARSLVTTAITKFPDPGLVMRIIRSFYGNSAGSFVFGPLLSGGMNAFLGQYDRAISDAQAGLSMLSTNPELYLIEGFSYCNLSKSAEAEAAYTRGIEADPTFGLLYLLRGEVRRSQGNLLGLASDLKSVTDLKVGAEFDQLVQDGINFKVTCQNFFTQSLATPTVTVTATP